MTCQPPAPKYSVIVPAYQMASLVGACLDALNHQTLPRDLYEIIVVDDGSTDGTGDVAAAKPGVCVIRQPNAGAAAARNTGAAAARGELLLFTDADCAPTPNWIAAMVAPFADPGVAGTKGTYLTHQRGVLPRFTQLEYQDRYDRMAKADSIDFVDTYSAAYRRDLFQINGGFDVGFLFDEDQEFSFRLTEKGYRLIFVPTAQVYHHHNTTLRAYVRRKFLAAHWKVLLAHRHPGRLVHDSHTPQTLKAQMILAALTLLALAVGALTAVADHLLTRWGGGPAWQTVLSIGGAAALAFLLTSIPFLVKVYHRDREILLPAIGLLWVRAIALGIGFASGLYRFRGHDSARRPPISGLQRVAKRSLDLLLGALTLIATAVPMAIIALAIRLDSRGPVLFRQTRIGQDGKPFRIVKFRTMVEDAESRLAQLVDLEALDQPAFKIRNDPRITRVGRFLRRWSLDELPQLFNVLRGEMSLVGPRPEEAAVVARYTDAQRRRLAVKPGMTGPMQVNGRGDLPFEQRLALELEYIERYSLRRDLTILLHTLPAVINGKGAY